MSTGTRPPAQTSPDGSDLSNRTLADFLLLRKLGQGGMGQVYLAEQISLKRKVALKLLRPDTASNPDALERFRLEAENVARATHANIVQVYAYGEVSGMPYMALEYVEGRNLKEFISKKGPPEVLVVVSIMRQVASALQRASELGIIHRDIKPENILLTRKGEVKVADFGLSRCLEGEQQPLHLTQTGMTMGTPLYMSPEQVEGKTVDSRTDIYSFGVTCYYMLTGQQPFRGETPFEVALAHVQKQPPPLSKLRPDLPEMLCTIVHKMLAKDPAQRHQTGRDLLRDLGRLRESLQGVTGAVPQATVLVEPVVIPPAVPAPDPTIPVASTSRPPVWLLLAVAGSILGMGSLGAALAWKRPAHPGGASSAGVRPADAGVLEAICLPNKHEQALRDAAEQYLNPPAGKPTDLNGGFGVCMDLGLYYLDENRFPDAEQLFARLSAFKEPRSYHLLGQLGLAIVLALRSQPKESNVLFHELFPPTGAKAVKKVDPVRGLQKFKDVLIALKPVLGSPNWRYWIARARWYNQMNGLPDSEAPKYLVRHFTYKAGAEPVKPPADKPGAKK